MADACAALRGRFPAARSAADKWRAFAREFQAAAEMPRRVRCASWSLTLRAACSMTASGELAAPREDADALGQLASEDVEAWRAKLVELAQGAPAAA